MAKRVIRLLLINMTIFLLLFLIIEIIFRFIGYIPGIYLKKFKPVENVEYQPIFKSDSLGITTYIPDSKFLPDKSVVNNLGFPSKYDFPPKKIEEDQGIKKIMIVGDSYTEGCCVNSIDSSFVGKLDAIENFKVFNFGVGGTDPLQYRLVLERYLDGMNPDLVIVAIYLGNDVMRYDRKPRPFIPHSFPIKNCGWLTSELFDGEKIVSFQTPEQSYEWFYNNTTILGNERPMYVKFIAKSALLSSLYFEIGIKVRNIELDPIVLKLNYTFNELMKIQKICENKNKKYLIVAIPSPMDAINNIDLSQKYDFLFSGIEWHYPKIDQFTRIDYTGKENRDHFNNSGHQKYYLFLKNLIELD